MGIMGIVSWVSLVMENLLQHDDFFRVRHTHTALHVLGKGTVARSLRLWACNALKFMVTVVSSLSESSASMRRAKGMIPL